jgi:hypothetical protein
MNIERFKKPVFYVAGLALCTEIVACSPTPDAPTSTELLPTNPPTELAPHADDTPLSSNIRLGESPEAKSVQTSVAASINLAFSHETSESFVLHIYGRSDSQNMFQRYDGSGIQTPEGMVPVVLHLNFGSYTPSEDSINQFITNLESYGLTAIYDKDQSFDGVVFVYVLIKSSTLPESFEVEDQLI